MKRIEEKGFHVYSVYTAEINTSNPNQEVLLVLLLLELGISRREKLYKNEILEPFVIKDKDTQKREIYIK